ncbi:hypothetical protein JOM56_012588, partial [Amanita muscaria]
TKNNTRNKIDPVVDDLVNADERGIGCQRQPFFEVFQESMSTASHLECDPSTPGGCPRCCPAPIQLCCDIHNPELVAQFTAFDLSIVKAPATARRSTIPASVEMNEIGRALEYDLEIWQRDKMKEKYGLACLKHEGAGLVMAETVRERIVKCARFGKIKTIPHLERETRWFGSHEYGSDIIQIIDKHYPRQLPIISENIVPPALLPLSNQIQLVNQGQNSQPVMQNVPRTKHVITCSVCNRPGHNSMSHHSNLYCSII